MQCTEDQAKNCLEIVVRNKNYFEIKQNIAFSLTKL